MLKRIALLALFISFAANAATPASITVAGVVFKDTANLVVLFGTLTTSSAVKYTTLRNLAGAGYAVPANKTLTVYACRIVESVVAAGSILYFGYGDNDVGQNGSAPTNVTGVTGNIATIGNNITTTAAAQQESAFVQTVPAGKYPMIANSSSTITADFYCYGYVN